VHPNRFRTEVASVEGLFGTDARTKWPSVEAVSCCDDRRPRGGWARLLPRMRRRNCCYGRCRMQLDSPFGNGQHNADPFGRLFGQQTPNRWRFCLATLLPSLVGRPCMGQDLECVTAQIDELTGVDGNEDTGGAPCRNLEDDKKDCLIDQCRRISNTAKTVRVLLGSSTEESLDGTAGLAKTSDADCCTTLTNRPLRGRRGRYVRVVHSWRARFLRERLYLSATRSLSPHGRSHPYRMCVLVVRSVSPAPRSHVSSLQSCAFLLYRSHPPPLAPNTSCCTTMAPRRCRPSVRT